MLDTLGQPWPCRACMVSFFSRIASQDAPTRRGQFNLLLPVRTLCISTGRWAAKFGTQYEHHDTTRGLNGNPRSASAVSGNLWQFMSSFHYGRGPPEGQPDQSTRRAESTSQCFWEPGQSPTSAQDRCKKITRCSWCLRTSRRPTSIPQHRLLSRHGSDRSPP